MEPMRGGIGETFKSQQAELDALQQQLRQMEDKIGGGAGGMAKMMD